MGVVCEHVTVVNEVGFPTLHLRCVMSSAGSFMLQQAEDDVHLLLRYEDSLIDASCKVGWTDQAFNTDETVMNRPVKQPP